MSKEQIEKDELFSILSNTINGANFDDLSEAVYKISDVAGFRKQSEGEWVANRHISISKRNRTIHYETYKCSVCGVWNGRHKQKFCPNCGAVMDGKERHEKQALPL